MTQKQCASCAKITPRVYQQGKCRDCLIKDLQELRPLIDFYREPANFPKPEIPLTSGEYAPRPQNKEAHLWLA
jgi:hypothetical protein